MWLVVNDKTWFGCCFMLDYRVQNWFTRSTEVDNVIINLHISFYLNNSCSGLLVQVVGIKVHANEGGVTQTRGGLSWVILPAGCNYPSLETILNILLSTWLHFLKDKMKYLLKLKIDMHFKISSSSIVCFVYLTFSLSDYCCHSLFSFFFFGLKIWVHLFGEWFSYSHRQMFSVQ